MKNNIRGLLVLALFFVAPALTLAVTESANSGYNDPVLHEAFEFNAFLNGDQVETSWNSYAPEGFNYYKVVRSTTNPDPVYPDDGYIQVTSDPDFTFYTDKEVPNGVSYYRVCSIVSPDRFCSNVVMIEYSGEPGPVNGEVLEEAVITLEGFLTNEGVVLEWGIDGGAPHGFKVAYSKVNDHPSYPGDSATYLSDPGARRFVHHDAIPGKTYHYRVCQYTGDGACLSYSNPVTVTLPGDYQGEPVPEKEGYIDEYQALKDEIAALKAKVAQLEAFVDIQQHQYSVAIDYLREKGIVQGYDDGSYKPDITINRAEFMKIIMGEKYGNELTADQVDCFNDVGKEWYAAYICLGKTKGIIHGYDNGEFRPGQYISFVEAAKILANVYALDLGDEGLNWYEKYVYALQNDGYIPSTIAELSKPITRAEMAELIWRIKEQKKAQNSINLISEPIKVNEGDFAGWQVYDGSDFTFFHPGWYQGEKWGWDILSEEKDYIDNLHVQDYMAVDTYVAIYDVSGSNLHTNVWFDHPLVSAQELNINGITALKRHFRAPRGSVVNGRTTGENENITVYTYLVNGRVVVLQYFNAHGTENKDVEIFEKIASSFSLK